jgi:WS/DGAT/MGAT family acyltransferase
MSARDAGFLYLERSNTQLHIGCIAILEGQVAREDLVARIEARLARLHRYAQRAMAVPFSFGHPSWEDDPGFRATDHVLRWGLPRPGNDAALLEATARLSAHPLDRGRPLWEMHLFEGLAGGRTALYQKVHHCMVDGMAGAQLLEVLLDGSPGVRDLAAARPGTPGSPDALPGPSRRLARAFAEEVATRARRSREVWRLLSRPAAARRAVERLRHAAYSALQLAVDDIPRLPWNAPLGPRRALAVTRLPMESVDRVRRARGASVNDVVLATLAGGLKRFLEADGFHTRGLEITALVPVSLRPPSQAAELGNRISAMLVPLAVDPAQEVARLAATRASVERLKSRATWTGIDALLELADGLPAPVVAAVGRQLRLRPLANVIATNVPGPRESRYLCGARVAALYPVVPIVDWIGLGLAVFSYEDSLYVGLHADADLVPNLEKLGRGIEEAFAALAGGA